MVVAGVVVIAGVVVVAFVAVALVLVVASVTSVVDSVITAVVEGGVGTENRFPDSSPLPNVTAEADPPFFTEAAK
jgi:hypothetical protein